MHFAASSLVAKSGEGFNIKIETKKLLNQVDIAFTKIEIELWRGT